MLDLTNDDFFKKQLLFPCTHCGALCSDALKYGDSVFCCAGCQTVYRFITEQGLAAYYTMAPTPDAQTAQQEKIRDFTAFDDPTFCTISEDGLKSITLYIEGIHCVACLWLLEKLPMHYWVKVMLLATLVRPSPVVSATSRLWELHQF